jgi:DNA polymerase-3 subunit delta'
MSDNSSQIDSNWNMVGHAWAVDLLRQQVGRGEARQAYLFTGPPGIGRRTLALRFAQALNCETPTAPGVPCATCYHCTQLERDIGNLLLGSGAKPEGGHPDLRVIQPVPGNLRDEEVEAMEVRLDLRPDRASLNLKVDQVRRANVSMSMKPYAARHRILLFVRFETATDGASNALLKTLEEAPAHGVLILTAESSEGLLPTIVSRCEIIRLQPVPLKDAQSFLEQRGADTAKARLLSHVSGGCPGAALRLLQDKGALEYRREKLGDLLELLAANRARRFAYAEKLGGDKGSMRNVLTLWLSFWRDVLWRASGASTPIANIDHEKEIETLSKRLNLPETALLVQDLDRALRKLEANVNARLLAEVLLLDWPLGSRS